jgi:hypothetical protein
MFLKFYHHLRPLFELKIALFIESMMIGIWTFLRWMWLTPINLQMFVHEKLLNFINIHYYKSWLFKRFNLTKVFTLTKRIFVLIKGMGNERHVVFFGWLF